MEEGGAKSRNTLEGGGKQGVSTLSDGVLNTRHFMREKTLARGKELVILKHRRPRCSIPRKEKLACGEESLKYGRGIILMKHQGKQGKVPARGADQGPRKLSPGKRGGEVWAGR